MMERQHHGSRFRSDLLRDALITLGGVAVAVLALDDITTDIAASFAFERTALAACGVWFTLVAWRLFLQGHPVLARVSLGVLGAAALAQGAIGPGTVPSLRWEYLATVGGLAWFVVVAGILAGLAWRPAGRHAA